MLLVVAAVFVIGGLVALFLIGRRASPGLVLALSVVIYLCGALFASSEDRLANLASGSLKLLGVGGFLLGAVGFVRNGRSARSPRAPRGPSDVPLP